MKWGLQMFLAWNYTLEAFFWIIVGGIALISLTIFMARPKRSTKLQEFDLHEGNLNESDSYSDAQSNLESETEEIDEAEFEAFVKKLPQSVQSIVSIRAAIAVLYGLLIMCFGFIDLEIDGTGCSNQNWMQFLLFFSCSIHETAVFLTSIVGGITLIYGVNQKSPFMSRWGGRLVATYCVFLLPDTGVYWFVAWKIFLTVLALTFSSDIFNFWTWSAKWEIRAEKNFIESFFTGIRLFLLFLIVLLLLIIFINVLQKLNQ